MEDTPTDPKEAQTGSGSTVRVERCEACSALVSDWVESETFNGRTCRSCEALAEQTERADRLQAEVEEAILDKNRAEAIHNSYQMENLDLRNKLELLEAKLEIAGYERDEWCDKHTRLTAALEDAKRDNYEVRRERDQAIELRNQRTAELDAVRKERDELKSRAHEVFLACNLEPPTDGVKPSVIVDFIRKRLKEWDAAQAKCAELEAALRLAKPYIEDFIKQLGLSGERLHGTKVQTTWNAIEALLTSPTQQAITNPSEAEMLNAEKLQFGQPLPAPPEEKRP